LRFLLQLDLAASKRRSDYAKSPAVVEKRPDYLKFAQIALLTEENDQEP
jgi:hypothetical protein